MTDADVVWPFEEVRVVFPDGSEHLGAPVLVWDLLGDLAVIGPVDTAIDPMVLGDGEALKSGSPVFLIGYPVGAGQFPQPAISRGLISRLSEWGPVGMTYFQVGISAAGGLSGGVLASEDGEVIGFAGLFLSEAQAGLVASLADVPPRVQRLIGGEGVAGLGDRRMPLEGGQLEHGFMLLHDWDVRMFLINEPPGTDISIEVESENDSGFSIVNAVPGSVIDLGAAFGDSANDFVVVDDTVTGVESGTLTTELGAPYFVIAGQNSKDPGHFQVRSDHNLIPYHDVDDGMEISVGQTLLGSMDHPVDSDYFVMDLKAGDMVDILVDSLNFDPQVAVTFPGASIEVEFGDDDSGGGLSGLNAKLTYRAPHSGSYFIVVSDATLREVGGYVLTLSQAPPGATPVNQ